MFCFSFKRGKSGAIFFTLKLLSILFFVGTMDVSASSYPSGAKSGGATKLNKLMVNVENIADQQQPLRKVLTGMIKDQTGQPLTGVTVSVKGTNVAVITDANGQFRINAPVNAKTLVFTFVGMKPQEVAINAEKSFSITMASEATQMQEVVVVGFGTQKKATVTGAVTSISSAKLMQSPVSNISNAMVGRVSGLLSTQASGAPGQDQSTLRIRGVGTFSGNTDPLIMVDGIESTNYNNIDPNEIESISVLKDASATAVYGVRGANGVIIISTKRGKLGGAQVSYSSQFALTRFAEMRKYAGSYPYALGYNDALHYDSYLTGAYAPFYSDAAIQHYKLNDSPLFYPNTDWIALTFKPTSLQTQHNVNISGGTETVKYFVSLGYFQQGSLFNEKTYDPGYKPENKYNRYNFRSNFDINITKRLKAVVNVSSQIGEMKGLMGSAGARTNNAGYIMSNVFMNPPTLSPGVWQEKLVNIVGSAAGTNLGNPLMQIYGAGKIKEYTNQLNGLVRLNYDLDYITKGLSAHGQLSYQNFSYVSTTFSKTAVQYNVIATATDANGNPTSYVLSPTTAENPFSGGESYNKRRQTDVEVGFDYLRKFGNHAIGGMFLYNQRKLNDPGLLFVVPSGYQGVVGRLTYDYKGRYLAEYNFGYNGTENFAQGKRFGYFPAYSAGWVVSEEPFFPKNKVLTYLKVRGSYGEVGNDKIGGTRFMYRPTSYTYSGTYNFGEVGSTINAYSRSGEGTLGNPVLTWERSKKLDVGADINLFKDKIRITIDYFDEKRSNILANKGTIPDMFGAAAPAYNLGKMENGGWDGEINYNNRLGDFNYFMKAVVTLTHNIVQFRDEVVQTYAYQYRTGQRYGQNFGLIAEGIYNTWQEVNDPNRPVSSYNSNRLQPGDFRYKDVNGDGKIDSFDQVPIGYSAFPEQTFGFSFGGDFKRFDFSVLLQGSGKYTHNASKKFNRGYQENGSTMTYLLDRSWTWQKYAAGITSDFPHLSSSSSQSNNYNLNTFWAEDASYVRLKNVEIGYTLNPKALKRLGVGSLRFYVNGSNLYTWSKLLPGEDPEIPTYDDGNNEPYPLTMVFNAGLNVKF